MLYPGGNREKAQDSMNVYEIITERILAELEKGTLPWHKPWKTGEGEFVDQVFSAEAHGEDWGEWLICETGGSDANAALIAAAPDLLEIIKRLCEPDLVSCEYGVARFKGGTSIDLAAAIAKAEGRG